MVVTGLVLVSGYAIYSGMNEIATGAVGGMIAISMKILENE